MFYQYTKFNVVIGDLLVISDPGHDLKMVPSRINIYKNTFFIHTKKKQGANMSTLTTSEIITQQQELIEQYRITLESHKNAREKLYDLLETLLETLKMNDPAATALVIKHLTILTEGKK